MKALVVADSGFGNTWNVANAIAGAMGDDAHAVHPTDVSPADLEGLEILVVGSPTQGGRPLPSIRDFVNGLSHSGLKGVNVAAFDTRMESGKNLPLKLLMNVIGFAAPKIEKALESEGGNRVAAPVGFFVEGKEGPLRKGELGRAAQWARELPPISPD